MFLTILQYIAFWLSYLVFPVIVVLVFFLFGDVAVEMKLLIIFCLILCAFFIYVRFVEPYRIIVRKEKHNTFKGKENLRVAVISDLHIGVFKGREFLNKVIELVIEERPDMVLIPGDLINDPSRKEFKGMFADLEKLEIPVFAVTGNHDSEVPGHYTSEEVRSILPGNVVALDNKRSRLEVKGRYVEVVGLSDLMEGNVDFTLLNEVFEDSHLKLLISHNPDMAYHLEGMGGGEKFDLMISGHTHGGQIFFKPLLNLVIPCEYPFIRGWYEVGKMKVYVSSGLGETVLPIRFLVPPEIVIMDILF